MVGSLPQLNFTLFSSSPDFLLLLQLQCLPWVSFPYIIYHFRQFFFSNVYSLKYLIVNICSPHTLPPFLHLLSTISQPLSLTNFLIVFPIPFFLFNPVRSTEETFSDRTSSFFFKQSSAIVSVSSQLSFPAPTCSLMFIKCKLFLLCLSSNSVICPCSSFFAFSYTFLDYLYCLLKMAFSLLLGLFLISLIWKCYWLLYFFTLSFNALPSM